MDVLRELQTYADLQLQLEEHMKAGLADMIRAKYAGGRKFQFGTQFLPSELHPDPDCSALLHSLVEPSRKLSATPSATEPLLAAVPSPDESTTSTTTLRNRKHASSPQHKTPTETNKDTTSSVASRDPALLFGSLSPPTLKSCSSHYKTVIQISVALVRSKRRILDLTKSCC